MNFVILCHLYSWNNFRIQTNSILWTHEYQGKEILASYGVRIQRGIVANNAVEAVAAAKQLTTETGTSWYVVKAQVHAGGRGKGGLNLLKNLQQVEEISEQIIECSWLHHKHLLKVKKST
jgi:succinyl-CoA synthetase beta subunit